MADFSAFVPEQPEGTQGPPTGRDPEDRSATESDEHALREKNLDKTLADSFPTSDPPSSIPDPSGEED